MPSRAGRRAAILFAVVMADDPRTLLRSADELVRRGRFVEANAVYLRVARWYRDQGFALKAVAVAKQIVTISEKHRLRQDPAVLRLLVEAYSALGLDAEAEAARGRLFEIEPPS